LHPQIKLISRFLFAPECQRNKSKYPYGACALNSYLLILLINRYVGSFQRLCPPWPGKQLEEKEHPAGRAKKATVCVPCINNGTRMASTPLHIATPFGCSHDLQSQSPAAKVKK